MRLVIALGGNALLPKGAKGTAGEQLEAAKGAVSRLEPLLRANEVVLTHGNGPQVGNLLLQQQATGEVAPMPLDVLDAMTQGQIGYFLASAISTTGLHSATLITRVIVDDSDPAFANPSKPVGPFYKRPPGKGYRMDAGRGYRLYVASPEPRKIREHDAITALLEKGFVVVAVGGGGIPIRSDGSGVEAVIDKDRAARLLANESGADTLVFVTSVECAYLDFGKGAQRPLRKATAAEAKGLMGEGHFAVGSMLPKVEAAVGFIEGGGKKAVICSIEGIRDALAGRAGTTIIP